MAGNLQPLDEKFAIVGPDGRPTLYFIQWCQQRQIDITEALTLLGLEEYLLAHPLQEGSGIQITPSGNLADSPTIEADVQEILDQITTTQGSILYRNASDWVALAPGSAGQILQSAGAGADPLWASGGGGGGWAISSSWDFSIDGAVANFVSGDLTGYSEVLVVFDRVTFSAATWRIVQVSTNGGASYDTTSGNYLTIDTNGVATNDGAFFAHSGSSTAARSGIVMLQGINLTMIGKPALTPARVVGLALYVGSANPINKVRAGGTTGNMNGGRAWILAR